MTTLDNAPGTTSNDSGASMSRRSLVRAGATAVWAVPAIQIATSAPAFAASGPTPVLGITSFSGTRETLSPKALDVTITIANSGTADTSTSIISTFTMDKGTNYYKTAPSAARNVAAGWLASGPAGNGNGPWVYTLTSSTVIPAGGSVSLTFTVDLKGNGGGVGGLIPGTTTAHANASSGAVSAAQVDATLN